MTWNINKTNLDQEYYFFSYCFTVRWNKRGRHTGTWSFQFIFSWILLQQMVKHTVLSKHSFPFKDLTAQHGDICWVEEGQNPCQSLLHRCENLVCKKQTCTCYTGGKITFSVGDFSVKKSFHCKPNTAQSPHLYKHQWQSTNEWDCKDHVGSRSFIWKLSLAQNEGLLLLRHQGVGF